MKRASTQVRPLPRLPLWRRLENKRIPLSFEFELTARCNNECRHCYINLPVDDSRARGKEMPLDQIGEIADQAVALGSLWCLITGGEPLLREDFVDVYLMLKKKGLLVSVYTNACLLNQGHIDIFKKYPPREMEVTVYGINRDTYESVTRRPGSYEAFRRGLDLLLKNNIKVRLKAMALRSNFSELGVIADFCRNHTKDYYRFDPILHLRYDGNIERNREIVSERLSPEEIVALEKSDPPRFDALTQNCEQYIFSPVDHGDCRHLFHCGAGNKSFSIGPQGHFRLCSSLFYPDFVVDLKTTTLADAWDNLVPRVRALSSTNPEFLEKCRVCPIINLCLWCPAHAHLETGRMDAWVDYFCQVAHARAAAVAKVKRQDRP